MNHQSKLTQVTALLTAYDIKVAEVSEVGPDRFEITGPTGIYSGALVSRPAMLWRAWLTRQVWHAGFRNCQRPLLNVYHEPFIQLDETTVFCLMEGAPQAVLLATPTDALRVGQTLAELHDALEKAISNSLQTSELEPFWDLVPHRYGVWSSKWDEGFQVIKSAHLFRDESESYATWDPVYNHLAMFEHSARDAISLLRQSAYDEYCVEAKNKRMVAWQLSSRSLFARAMPVDKVLVQLVRDPLFDSPLTDLALLCYEMSLESEGATLIEHCLRAYQDIRPLSLQELSILRAYVHYPHYAIRWIHAARHHNQRELAHDWLNITIRHQETLRMWGLA